MSAVAAPVSRWKAMLDHPLARRYMLRSVSTGDNRIYTAEDVLGERLVKLGAFLSMAEKDMPIRTNLDVAGRYENVDTFASMALSAGAYLWTETIREQLVTVSVPRHVVSAQMMPEPRMWFTYETGISSSNVSGNTEDATIDCHMVYDAGDHLRVVDIGEIDGPTREEGTPYIGGWAIKYGSVFPDDFPDPVNLEMVEYVLRMLAFVNSPFLPKDYRRISRPARREMARAGAPGVDDLVRFITLRRPHTPHHGDETAEGNSNWKHSWVVSGHMRAQWYPREGAHHLIYIAPYLKGPADAPLLQHAYKVAR